MSDGCKHIMQTGPRRQIHTVLAKAIDKINNLINKSSATERTLFSTTTDLSNANWMMLRVIYAVTEAVQGRGRHLTGATRWRGTLGSRGWCHGWGVRAAACTSLRVHFTNPPKLSGLTCVRSLLLFHSSLLFLFSHCEQDKIHGSHMELPTSSAHLWVFIFFIFTAAHQEAVNVHGNGLLFAHCTHNRSR